VRSSRRSSTAHAAAATAWAALVIGVACSRTEDPIERFATGNAATAPGKGGGPTGSGGSAATTGGALGGQSNPGGKSPGAGDSGSSASGSTATGEAGSGSGLLQPPELECGEPPVSGAAFTRQALRAAAADCASYHYCRFEGAARWLSETVSSYAEQPSDVTLSNARVAYASALSLWSVLEQFQFGPLASNDEGAAKDSYQGRGIRERIYAWPLTARCRVEEQIANQNYLNDIDKVLVTGRGLFGLDYLLFYPGSDTACSASSVAAKNWLNFDDAELAQRKLRYATALGDDIVSRVVELRRAWAPDGENFRLKLVDATGYPSEQEAMKVLGWALLYVEHEVKDWKLGVPAGYTLAGPVELPEGPYSGLGTEALRGNLLGFRALYQGCGPAGEGIGFDDWLSEAGHPELAQEIIDAYQAAQAVAEAFPPWSQATPAEMDALYRAVKALTDPLKNDLFGGGSPLGLTLPPTLSGDTD
jgi:uncharacterized protein